MKSGIITTYPYATQTGSLNVPENLDEKATRKYISDHWDDIQFNDVELDYAGTEFDVDDE